MTVFMLMFSKQSDDNHVFSSRENLLEYVSYWFLTPSEARVLDDHDSYLHDNLGLVTIQQVKLDAGLDYIRENKGA